MSANQIPGPYSRTTNLGAVTSHSCPRCWRNGGIGHHFDNARTSLAPEPTSWPNVAALVEWATTPAKTTGRTR